MEPMKLYINGCSFTAGEAHKFRPFWPSFFEADHEIVANESYPGVSNHRIIRRTIEFINRHPNPSSLVFLIQLTNCERSEWYDAERNIWIGALNQMANFDDKWRDRPWADGNSHAKDSAPYDALQKKYFSVAHNHQSLEKDMLSTMEQILLLQAVFRRNRIEKYLFIPMSKSADPRTYQPEELNVPYFNEMLDTIRKKHFTDITISELCRGLEVSAENGHPNRAGHEKIYRYILNELEEKRI